MCRPVVDPGGLGPPKHNLFHVFTRRLLRHFVSRNDKDGKGSAI